MALTKERVAQITHTAIDIICEVCKDIPQKNLRASQTPENAWISEVYEYASFLANADGSVSRVEVTEMEKLLKEKAPYLSKAIVELTADTASEARLDAIPSILPALLEHDRVTEKSGEEKIAVSMWLFYVYYWVTAFVIQADDYEHPHELIVSSRVLDRMHEDICSGLGMPYETMENALKELVNYEGS